MKCPRCKGSKVNKIEVKEYGEKGYTYSQFPCVTCKGAGEISEEQLKNYEHEQQMWCECEESIFGSYPEDGACQVKGCRVHKHHVHCGTCGKITQIG